MRYFILYTALLALFIGCKKSNQNIDSVKSLTVQQDLSNSTNNKGIEFLKEFYTKFYGEYRDRKGIENYVSSRILKRMDSLTKGDELILDYDPFINGQDWDINLLKKSLEIKPLVNENEYRVSFKLFEENDNKTNIDLLINNDKGKYLIYSILNDEYLNFKAQKNDVSAKNIVSSNKELISIKGLWRISCGSDFTIFDINDNEGYLSLYSFNKIFINTILKQTAIPNEYDLYFKSTEFKQKYYDNYEYIENDDDISSTEIIGKIKVENKSNMTINWMGLYNKKLKKIQFANSFLFIKENGGKNPVILEKCE